MVPSSGIELLLLGSQRLCLLLQVVAFAGELRQVQNTMEVGIQKPLLVVLILRAPPPARRDPFI